MPDYQQMYAVLCAAASEALDLLPDCRENQAGRQRLQEALWQAEEQYLRETE